MTLCCLQLQDVKVVGNLPKSFLQVLTFVKTKANYEYLHEVLTDMKELRKSTEETVIAVSQYNHMMRLQVQLLVNQTISTWEEFQKTYPSHASADRLTALINKLGPIRQEREAGAKRGGCAAGWYATSTSDEPHALIVSYLQEADQEQVLLNRTALGVEAFNKNAHTHKVDFFENHNPPFYNVNEHDDTIKCMRAYWQVRNTNLENCFKNIENNEWDGVIMDVEYLMDDMDAENEDTKYTREDEFERFMTQLKGSNKRSHYTIAVFLGARQVEPYRAILMKLFPKVQRRYWYKWDRVYVLPGGDKVPNRMEHCLLAFQRPSTDSPWKSWQYNISKGDSNVYDCKSVVQGLTYESKVRTNSVVSYRDDTYCLLIQKTLTKSMK